MNKVQYGIVGIQNPQMITQVENALKKLDGVQFVDVDMGKATIEVDYNEPTHESEIKQCIRHTGFEIE